MSASKRRLAGRSTGDKHMRDAFEEAIDTILARFSPTSKQRTISWNTIKRLTILSVDYARYHFRARGFYVNPSTSGTKPMRFRSFKIRAIRNVNTEILRSLKLGGLQTKGSFTVRLDYECNKRFNRIGVSKLGFW